MNYEFILQYITTLKHKFVLKYELTQYTTIDLHTVIYDSCQKIRCNSLTKQKLLTQRLRKPYASLTPPAGLQ